MKKYQYMQFERNEPFRDSKLNEFGSGGWELVSVSHTQSTFAPERYFYAFKRPITNNN